MRDQLNNTLLRFGLIAIVMLAQLCNTTLLAATTRPNAPQDAMPIVGGTSYGGAAQLTPNVEYSSSVSTSATDDFFYFDITPGPIATLAFTSTTNWSGSAEFDLFDQLHISYLIYANLSTQEQAGQLVYAGNNSTPTRYYVRVVGQNASKDYLFKVSLENPSDGNQPGDASDTFDAPRWITPTVGSALTFTGTLGGADTEDWYRLATPPGQMISVSVTVLDYNTTNLNARLHRELFDQTGVQSLGYGDTYYPSKQPTSFLHMANNTTPSSYLLSLKSFNSGVPLRYRVDVLLSNQTDGNQPGDAGDTFDTARNIGPDLESNGSRIGAADSDDYYRIDLPIAPGDKRPYTFTLDSVPWPPDASVNARLDLTLYKANRAEAKSTSVNAPLTDKLDVSLTGCDLCYIKVHHNGYVPQLRYFFKLAAGPSSTPVVTITPVITVTPPTTTTLPPTSFEPNDTCSQANAITTDGLPQLHIFEQPGDVDWLKFEAKGNTQYAIEITVPPESQSDVGVELYAACNATAVRTQNLAYTPGARMEYTPAPTGTLYLRIANGDPSKSGPNTRYYASVRDLSAGNNLGAVIIVSGRIKANDPVQPNIDSIAETVYALFQKQGYTDDRIQYFTTKAQSVGRDGTPTKAALQAAITTWAKDKVAGGRPLTVYLVDHGDPGKVYLDKTANEWITPDELDGWLSELEAAVPNVKINVFIEACNSGSFIVTTTANQAADQAGNEPEAMRGLSKPGRVVITSAGARNLAYVSASGAIFSDSFLNSLSNGSSVQSSFQSGQWAAKQAHSWQTSLLDANGNGIPNEKADEDLAATRGFGFAGTLSDEKYPPYIASVASSSQIVNGRAEIRAEVRDDVAVKRVWMFAYPPGYAPPQEGNELQFDLGALGVDSAILVPLGGGKYAVEHGGFTRIGTYRVVIHAEDDQGNEAQPVSFDLKNGGALGGSSAVFLPLVRK